LYLLKHLNDSQWDSTIEIDEYLRSGKGYCEIFMKYFANYFTTKIYLDNITATGRYIDPKFNTN